jgi:hypothetical protein
MGPGSILVGLAISALSVAGLLLGMTVMRLYMLA